MPTGVYKRTKPPSKKWLATMKKVNTGNQYRKGIPAWSKGKKLPQFSGEKACHWKGGEYEEFDGYIMIHSPQHPLRTKNNYVRRSHLVMEEHLGRHLKSTEIVHHIDRNKSDDRLENLQIMTRAEHINFHRKDLKSLEP